MYSDKIDTYSAIFTKGNNLEGLINKGIWINHNSFLQVYQDTQ